MKTRILTLAAIMMVAAFTVAAQNAKSRTEPLTSGATAPDFTLSDQNGKSVTLSKVAKPVVLVFYRGYWCPFCARQLAELRTLKADGDDFDLFAITVDDASKTKSLAAKIAADGKGNVEFPLLSDPGNKTIDAYGLFDPTYLGQKVEGIPHPAIVIVDAQRKIRWIKVESDYKIRPTNADIRAELAKLK